MTYNATHRRLDRLEGPKVPTKSLLSYRDDPLGYARDVLKVYLTPQQQQIALAVATGTRSRVLVPSANETGKSFEAGFLASWFYDTRKPGMVIITAPSAAQVVDIVFRELRKLRRHDKNFSPKAPFLSDAVDHLVKGYTAKEQNAFHGRHEEEVLVIFDEAEGIDAQFWTAAESFADRLVCFYNPVSSASQAAIEEQSGSWNLLRLSALDHPNVIADLNHQPRPVPGAVNLEKAISRLVKWGRELDVSEHSEPGDVVLGDRKFRPSPIGEARVLGRRPKRAVKAVIDLAAWEKAETQRYKDIKPSWKVTIGCDVARFGTNNSVFHVRRGPVSVHHESRNGMTGPQVAAKLRQLADEYSGSPELGPTVPCIIDSTGLGNNLPDWAMGYNFIGVNASAKAVNIEDYPNIRSELHFDFADCLNAGLVDLSRLPGSVRGMLKNQLSAVEYDYSSRGQRVVDEKAVVEKKLNGQSPDDADAMLLAYYVPEIIREVS